MHGAIRCGPDGRKRPLCGAEWKLGLPPQIKQQLGQVVEGIHPLAALSKTSNGGFRRCSTFIGFTHLT
jgi:hypothetical protein